MRRFLFCCLLWLVAVAAPAQTLNTPYYGPNGILDDVTDRSLAEMIVFLPGNRFVLYANNRTRFRQGEGWYKRRRNHLTLVFTADPYKQARQRVEPTRISFRNLDPAPDTLTSIRLHLIDNVTGNGIPNVGFEACCNESILTDSAGWATSQRVEHKREWSGGGIVFRGIEWGFDVRLKGYDLARYVRFPYRHVEITIQAGPSPKKHRFIRAGKRWRYLVQPSSDSSGEFTLRGRRFIVKGGRFWRRVGFWEMPYHSM